MPTVLHWFRRDLRIRDNTALAAACAAAVTLNKEHEPAQREMDDRLAEKTAAIAKFHRR